jgi:hypothetical protein
MAMVMGPTKIMVRVMDMRKRMDLKVKMGRRKMETP